MNMFVTDDLEKKPVLPIDLHLFLPPIDAILFLYFIKNNYRQYIKTERVLVIYNYIIAISAYNCLLKVSQ